MAAERLQKVISKNERTEKSKNEVSLCWFVCVLFDFAFNIFEPKLNIHCFVSVVDIIKREL